MYFFSFLASQYLRIIQWLHVLLKEKHYFRTCILIHKALKDNCLFILPPSLGDAIYLLSNLEQIEKEKQCKLMPVIKPSLIPVAKLCHCDNFIVSQACFESAYIYIPIILKYKCLTGKSLEKRIKQEIKKGYIFFAHPAKYDSYAETLIRSQIESGNDYWNILFNMNGLRMSLLTELLPMSRDFECDYKQTIVLCPDCYSYNNMMFSCTFWDQLASQCKQLGYHVFYNANNKITYLQNAIHLEYSWQDIIGICQRAAYVISFRSGLCDILAAKGKHLIVLYPDGNFILHLKLSNFQLSNKITHKNFFQFHSLNFLFSRNDIQEFVFPMNCPSTEPILKYIKDNTISLQINK